MSNPVIDGYDAAAAGLIARYEAVSSHELYAPVRQLLPNRPETILDIGAGTGRDAAWFAGLGHRVLAVEPVAAFREAGKALHGGKGIEWLNDTLPGLERVLAREELFDVVALSAVWHHLQDQERQGVFANLNNVTARQGLVIMSIRHGPGAPSRPVFEARVSDAVDWASGAGFRLILEKSTQSQSRENRAAGVSWTWLAFRAA